MPQTSMQSHSQSRMAPLVALVAVIGLAYVASVEASRPDPLTTAVRGDQPAWLAEGSLDDGIMRLADPKTAWPTRVATVDVLTLAGKVDERAEWDMRIAALQASINEEAQTRQAALERRLQESEATEDEEVRQTIRDEVALMQLQYQQWIRVKALELNREQELKWKSIYRNLSREANRIAEAKGYELVLMNGIDTNITIDPNLQIPPDQQALAQILNRRILHSSDFIDITDEVIVRMNNATPQP